MKSRVRVSQRLKKKLLRLRDLRAEQLKERVFLSVSALDYAAHIEAYPDLNLPNFADNLNIIEIGAANLTSANFKEAIIKVGTPTGDDWIFLQTTDEATTFGFKTNDGLVDFGYRKYYRIQHGNNELSKGQNLNNGIENFRGLDKISLSEFRGISKQTRRLYPKECAIRAIRRNEGLYKIFLKELDARL